MQVDFIDNKLKIKIYGLPRAQFDDTLNIVRQLEGTGRFGKAVYIPSSNYWEALPTKNNIEVLRFYNFNFTNNVKPLLESKKDISILITVLNHKVIVDTDIELLMQIYDEFKYDDYRYCFVGGRFDALAIVKRHYFNIKDDYGECKIGFLTQLLEYLNEKYDYELVDKRTRFTLGGEAYEEIIKNNLTYLTLYDYQVEAVKLCVEKINGIIKLPTSAGKTEVFLSLCNLMGCRTLILFSRIDLARQTLKRAKKAGLDAGIVQGNEVDENHQVIMCTVQSAHKLYTEYEMVIVDECHRGSAKGYQQLLKRKDFIYRLGFSATPFINNKNQEYKNIAVRQYLGDIIYTLKADSLIEDNKIAKPKIKFIDIREPILSGEKWPYVEYSGIVENNYRNDEIVKIANEYKNVLILVKKINHGDELERLISNSVWLSGNSPVDIREQAVKDFEAGKDIVLIASTIFDEGISINRIRNLIIAGGGASPIKTIQRLGRGLRLAEGKTTVNVFDFMDYTNKILERHSKNRYKTYISEGFIIEE